MGQQDVLFLVQILGLVFLMIYVVKTWEMASATRKAAEATEQSVIEMRETRDLESAPYVITYFDIPTGSSLIYLVVKNIGRSLATQVRLTFDPPLRTSDASPWIEELGFIKSGIESMPPNYEIRTLFDSAITYFGNDGLPLKYHSRITFFGGVRLTERVIEQTVDLSAQKGLGYVDYKDMDDLVKQIEVLARETKAIRDATGSISSTLKQGIMINNPSVGVTIFESELPKWRHLLFAKLREFEGLWCRLYNEDRLNGINLSRLKAYLLILSDQIATILAHRPDGAPPTIIDSTAVIAKRLHDLSVMDFFADGGRSLRNFNDLGDAVILDIAALKGMCVDAA